MYMYKELHESLFMISSLPLSIFTMDFLVSYLAIGNIDKKKSSQLSYIIMQNKYIIHLYNNKKN